MKLEFCAVLLSQGRPKELPRIFFSAEFKEIVKKNIRSVVNILILK